MGPAAFRAAALRLFFRRRTSTIRVRLTARLRPPGNPVSHLKFLEEHLQFRVKQFRLARAGDCTLRTKTYIRVDHSVETQLYQVRPHI